MGCAKCSSVGISFVPTYSSVAYLLDGTAENDRIDGGMREESRGVEGDAACRKQRRLALLPASRVMDAAILNEMIWVICDQTKDEGN